MTEEAGMVSEDERLRVENMRTHYGNAMPAVTTLRQVICEFARHMVNDHHWSPEKADRWCEQIDRILTDVSE